MFILTPIKPSPEQQSLSYILKVFRYQKEHWHLDSLLRQFLSGQHAAQCQLGWYLQYEIPYEEIEKFLNLLNKAEHFDPKNPYIPLIKMTQHLYGLGVPSSLENSRHYLQKWEEHYAQMLPHPNDIFLNTVETVNQLPPLDRHRWFATQGDGDALCEVAKYYLEEPYNESQVKEAIALLCAVAEYGHYRALQELTTLYREGKVISPNITKANHYARKGFLRQVLLYPDKPWRIKDLPVPGYSERLTHRSIERIYHETLCLLFPQYDFLFNKNSSLVPLVHTPTVRGIVENIKNNVTYFIENIIRDDKDALKSPRLKRSLNSLLKYYTLPKIQRDQIRLLLAYQHSLDKNPSTTAEYVTQVKQPYAYSEFIRQLDPQGQIGLLMLSFIQQPQSIYFDDSEVMLDYALIYLIACRVTLDACGNYRLKQTLYHLFDTHLTQDISLEQLCEWHIRYCQSRYSIYKIYHFIKKVRAGWFFLRHNKKKATFAWRLVLEQIKEQHQPSFDTLKQIQSLYPSLTNSLNQLSNIEPAILKRLQPLAEYLLSRSP